MEQGSAATPRTILVVDVESFGDKARTDQDRMVVRAGMYELLEAAFADSGVSRASVTIEDRGDGALVLLSADVPKAVLVDRMPPRIDAELRRYNARHSIEARMRLRIALHAGEVRDDRYGVVADAVNFTFRILEAREAKRALGASTASFVLIVSDWFFQSVVTHEPAAHPAAFRAIPVDVKETHDKAWIRLFGEVPARTHGQRRQAARREPTLRELSEIVDVLLEIPVLETKEGRDQVLRELDPDIWSSIPRHMTAKTDLVSIVRTCLRHGDAWERLVEVIRFFAGGFDAVTKLEATQDRLELEGDQ